MPVPVVGGHVFATLTNQGEYTCGLDTAGAAWCWGQNSYGQLGDGTNIDRYAPIAVSGGHTFRTLTAGLMHTCGLDSAGTSWCWGNNSTGALGDGTTISRAQPVAVCEPVG